jgi:23S rRNA pseudouridine1911/1915/1917 synthase
MPQEVPGFQSRPRRPPPEPEPIDIRILYEDDSLIALIAIDKPPGLVVHPTYRNWSGTLLNGLLWHVRGRAGIQPRIMTRLDKDTSGVVLAALTADIHTRLQRASILGRLRKQYLALVHGTPQQRQGTITLPLGRSADDRRRVVVTSSGQPCHTIYEVVASAGRHSLVRCELLTGRTHQIRVHLAAQGWPVAGDRVYGTPDSAPRQALHAWRLALAHPVTGVPLELEAAIPADLERLLSELRLALGVRTGAPPPSG